MSDFDRTKLRRLDLTVLLVFLGLMRSRKAADVARELGLTQSSISHALGRLRDVFGDPLFLRRPHGMEPTSVALALAPEIAGAVDRLRAALGGAQAFTPATATGELRIAAWDSVQALLAPPLVARVMAEAPGLRLAFRMLAREEALAALDGMGIDLTVGYFPGLGSGHIAEPLYDETYLAVARPGLLDDPPSLARYLALPHLLVSPRGEFGGVVDAALRERGLGRRVVATLPQVVPALAVLARTEAVATLPARVARRFAPVFGLHAAPPPLPVRPFTVAAVRHARSAGDARLDWIVARIAAALAPGP